METQTTEEVKEDIIKKMGTDFGSLFHSLYNEITWLTFKWIEFKELFGSKESRFELMNKAAPFFFYTVQKTLWENLLLGVARITDPPESFKKKNTTLQAIGQHLLDPTFRADFEKDLMEILDECKFCRDWRNRWIAHMDYELGVNRDSAKPLEPATRLKLRLTIEKIHSLYNKISLKYLGSTVAWQVLTSDRGAISLLHKIEDGIRFDEEEHKRMLNGNWKPDDYNSLV